MRPETTQRERFDELHRLLHEKDFAQFMMAGWGPPDSHAHCLGGWLPYDEWFKREGWHVIGLSRPAWNIWEGFAAFREYFKITHNQSEFLFGVRRLDEFGNSKDIFLARLNKLEAELFTIHKKKTSTMQVVIVEPAEQDQGLPLDALKAGEVALILKSIIADDVGRLVVRGKYGEDAVLGSTNTNTGFMQQSIRASGMRVRRLPKGTTVTITL
jgi:hypothetical protein